MVKKLNRSAKLDRRLLVQKGINDLDPHRGMSNVCSFLVFDMTSFSLKSWISRATSFRLLRVLDLEGVPIETVPDEVAILFNLRCLGSRRTLVKELPRSSGRLRNLQTLDLYDSKIEKLPHGITQLKNLRHLFVESIRDPVFAELASDPGVKAPKGIWNLKNLQALQSVEADEDMVRHLGHVSGPSSGLPSRVGPFGRGGRASDPSTELRPPALRAKPPEPPWEGSLLQLPPRLRTI